MRINFGSGKGVPNIRLGLNNGLIKAFLDKKYLSLTHKVLNGYEWIRFSEGLILTLD